MAIDGNKVCVIGISHLGAVTSVCLSDLGYTVVGADKDRQKVDQLNNGQPPIYEPGLEELLQKNLKSQNLRYTNDFTIAIADTRYVLITYDTPVDETDEVDLSELFTTISEIAPLLQNGTTVIISSQVPVGTCEQLAETIRKSNTSLSFGLAYTPENLRLGQAIERFKNPDMIVIGTDSKETQNKVEQFLTPIEAPKVAMDLRSSEMTKHTINAYLATIITFANEMANFCDEVDADALKVSEALRLDARVSPKAPLLPGLAFGGGHLARDMKVLLHLGERTGYEAPLIKGILRGNEQQNKIVIDKLKKLHKSLKGLTVGLLGLTYKPGTSTLHRSAALDILLMLVSEGAVVKAYDPKADPKEVEPYLKYLTVCKDPYSVAQESDALMIITAWPEFKELDFSKIQASMKNPILLDAPNMLDADLMSQTGFVYQGVGRSRRLETSGDPK